MDRMTNRCIEDSRIDKYIRWSRFSRVNTNFPPYPLCKFSQVCYRGVVVVDFPVHFPVAFLHFPSLWPPFSFHFTGLELLMYQATRIDGVRSHFVVNTASTVVSMRTTGSASRFNNRAGTLSRVPHSKTSNVHAHTRSETIRLWPPTCCESSHENRRHRRWTMRRDASEGIVTINDRAEVSD